MNTKRKRPGSGAGVQDVAISLVTRVGVLFSGVLIQSLLAYALLPDGRGEFAVCILFASMSGVLLTPGAEAGAQYLVMAKRITVSQAVAVSLLICVFATIIATVVSLPLISRDVGFFGKADDSSFYIAICLIPLVTFSNALRHQLAGLRRFKRLAVYSLIQTSANGLVLLLLVFVLRLRVEGALIAACAGNIVVSIACIGDLVRNKGLKWIVPSLRDVIEVVRYGLKYHIARIGSGVDARFGVLLLGLIAGRVEIGLFAVASGLMMRSIAIPNAVFVALLPRVSDHGDGNPTLVAFCSRTVYGATGVAVALLVVLSRPLVQMLFSSEFLAIIPLIWIIAPGVWAYTGASITIAYFRATNRPGVCSWAVGCGLACNAIIVPLLYPIVGVRSAGWGMAVGLIVRSVVLLATFYRVTGMPFRSLLIPRVADFRRVVAMTGGMVFRRGSGTSNGS